MTANEQAAQAAAERCWPDKDTHRLSALHDAVARHGFVVGAEWAEAALLARLSDPDPALVEAVAMAIAEARYEDPEDSPVWQNEERFNEAEAALAAAAAHLSEGTTTDPKPAEGSVRYVPVVPLNNVYAEEDFEVWADDPTPTEGGGQ